MRLVVKMTIVWLALTEICAADCRTEMQRSDRILKCHVYDMSCENPMKCEYIGNCGEQFDQSGCLVALRYAADGLGIYYCDREDKWNISAKKQNVINKICGTSRSAPPRKRHAEPIKKKSKTFGEAAKDGDVSAIRHFIKQGADINAPDKDGHTPLMKASMWGQLAAMDALLGAGADVSLKTERYGLTALMLAAREGRTRAIDKLLKAGAKLEARSAASYGNYTAIYLAASAGQVSALNALVNAGADVNVVILGKITPLIRASEHADVKMVEALLAAGADVNARDRNGFTALDWVPIRGGDSRKRAKVRTMLLKAGAVSKQR